MKYLILIILFTAFNLLSSEGLATYYTVQSCLSEGNSGIMANGKPLIDSNLTCAMRRRDWGTQFKVTNLENGKEVIVQLFDYGSGKGPTKRGVIIDLSLGAWKALGLMPLGSGKKSRGECKVKVEEIVGASNYINIRLFL